MIERSFFESFDLSNEAIDVITAKITSDTESETAQLKTKLSNAETALADLENEIAIEKRKALVYGALKAAGMTSELALNSAADMLVSENADVNDTVDEEIEKLKSLDPAAFAPVPRPHTDLPAFSSAAPAVKLPDSSPLFENGTPIFSFLRRPQNNG